MAKIELTAYMIRANSAVILLSASPTLSHQKEIPWTHVDYIVPRQPQGCISISMEPSAAEFFGLYTKPAPQTALQPQPATQGYRASIDSLLDKPADINPGLRRSNPNEKAFDEKFDRDLESRLAASIPSTRSKVSLTEAALATRHRVEAAPLVLDPATNEDEDHETDYRFQPSDVDPGSAAGV